MANFEKASEKANALKQFEGAGIRRTRTGYYFLSHPHPLRAMRDIEPKESESRLAEMVGQLFELYVHFLFCEISCPFCHFFHELMRGEQSEEEEKWLGEISTEIALYRAILGRIPARSFYIGGGTPSLMSVKTLTKLMGVLNQNIDFQPGADIKYEILPKQYGPELEDKLGCLRTFGFTDLVVDIQSGNSRSLKTISRGGTSLENALNILERSMRFGFSRFTVGLMIGLPYESPESLEQTINTLAAIPEVAVIKTVPLITREPDRIAEMLKKNPQNFATSEERDALWIFARDLLLEKGFSEGPLCFYRRIKLGQQARKFEGSNLLGFGPSAFGYWSTKNWGMQEFNFCNREDYGKRLQEGKLPIWRAAVLDPIEQVRRQLILGLASCQPVDLRALDHRFRNVSVDLYWGRELNALHYLGLVEVVPAGLRLTDAGLARAEEVCYFLGDWGMNNFLAEPVPAEEPHRIELLRHNYYPSIPIEDRQNFAKFASQFHNGFMARFPKP